MHVNINLLSNLVLVGDFNVNFFNPEHPLFSNNSVSLSPSLCLTQVVSEPTHFSLIDLVFLSDPSHLIGCVTIPALANSDHLGVSFSAGGPDTMLKNKHQKIWR